jgi:hypothetical protein
MDDRYLDESLTRSQAYTITVPPGGWRRVFPRAYIEKIQPIAETLAMMSHRPSTDYESYLQEADAVYRNKVVHITEPSWIKKQHIMNQDPVCQELWNKLQMLIALKEDENGNN